MSGEIVSPLSTALTDEGAKNTERIKNDLATFKALEMCAAATLVGIIPLYNSRPERDWDRFFERLEEKFICCCVPMEYRERLARRMMRGTTLTTWVQFAQKKADCDYESVRDQTMLTYFPKPTEFQRLLRSMAPEPNNTEPLEGVDKEEQLHFRPKRVGMTIAQAKEHVTIHRIRLERVQKRHPSQQMPPESDFIQMALTLLRPATAELATPEILNQPTVDAFLNTLADFEQVLDTPPVPGKYKRFRNKPRRQLISAAAQTV